MTDLLAALRRSVWEQCDRMVSVKWDTLCFLSGSDVHPLPSALRHMATLEPFSAVSKRHMSHTVFILRAMVDTLDGIDLNELPHKSCSYKSNEILTTHLTPSDSRRSLYSFTACLWRRKVLHFIQGEKQRWGFKYFKKQVLFYFDWKRLPRLKLISSVLLERVAHGWKSILINVLGA